MRHNQPTSMLDGFNDLRNDYDAAKNTRFSRRLTGVQPLGSGFDYHIRNEKQFLYLMELARHFDRNDVVVPQAITRLVDNVLQDGVKLDVRTGDDDLNKYLTENYADWSSDAQKCDAAQEHNLHRKAKMTLRAVIVDGDICHLPLKTGAIDTVEAHRLRNPKKTQRNVVHGVLLDAQRKRLEYWFTRQELNPMSPAPLFRDLVPIKARDKNGHRQVFHVYNPRRVSQTRGVTALAPIANSIGMHDDLQFSNLVKAQLSSCFAIIENVSVDAPSVKAAVLGATEDITRSDGSIQTLEGLSPGMRIKGAPGTTLSGFSPNVPNPEFFPHTMLILSFIAINLGMPVQMLLLDPTKTNFSGWRGAIDQARIGFRELQTLMIDLFYRPIYEFKVRQWHAEDAELQRLVAIAETKNNAKLLGHRWQPPNWPYIEPKKDADADSLRLKSGLISPRRLHAERGRDYDDVVVEIVEDRSKMIRLAMTATEAIKSEFPKTAADLDWREVGTGLQLPPGVIDKEPAQKQGQEASGSGPQAPDPKNLHDDREAALAGSNGEGASC